MFIVDDVLLRTLLGSHPIQAFDLIFVMEQIRNQALKTMYDIPKINDQIKELRMLYELGDFSKEEYDKQHAELMQKLDYAKKVEEMCERVNAQIDVG